MYWSMFLPDLLSRVFCVIESAALITFSIFRLVVCLPPASKQNPDVEQVDVQSWTTYL